MTVRCNFVSVDHPSLPLWLREGLDTVFNKEPGVLRVTFNLWCSSGYSDESYINEHAEAFFTRDNHTTEEQLDNIPSVRMLERKAMDFWNLFPVKMDGEGVNGELDIYAERNRFFYSQQMHDLEEPLFEIEIFEKDGQLVVEERLHVAYGGSLTDLIIGSEENILNFLDPADIAMKELPKVKEVRIVDDEPVFILEPGELVRCQAE